MLPNLGLTLVHLRALARILIRSRRAYIANKESAKNDNAPSVRIALANQTDAELSYTQQLAELGALIIVEESHKTE